MSNHLVVEEVSGQLHAPDTLFLVSIHSLYPVGTGGPFLGGQAAGE